jgi:hypothetical protein
MRKSLEEELKQAINERKKLIYEFEQDLKKETLFCRIVVLIVIVLVIYVWLF